MSYRRPDTGNTMNDYFTALNDFNTLLPNLEKARSPEAFEIWMDKLIQIDKRSFILYIRKNTAGIPPRCMDRAKARLGHYLDGI